MHFAHANGYPPLSYKHLLTSLANSYNVTAMNFRPLWPGAHPFEISNWCPLAEDLRIFLDQQGFDQIIAAGHSMGATTTLRLALQQPHRFIAIILIDPVLLPPWMVIGWNFIYMLGLASRVHPLVRGALRRKRIFDSYQAMFINYRKKQVFMKLTDRALMDYIMAIGRRNSDGNIELTYPPEWEARIYETGVRADQDIWQSLYRLVPPLLIIRGSQSDTFSKSTAQLVQKHLPGVKVISIPQATHLVPLEAPEVVYQAIVEFISEVKLIRES